MEAVLPLNKLPELLGLNKNETEYVSDTPIVINIDGREVFRVMSPYMGKAARGW